MWLWHDYSLFSLSTCGPRSFAVVGPTIWNNLPEYLRDPELSIDNFRRQLKTFLFAQYWRWHPSALETIVPVRSINLLFTIFYITFTEHTLHQHAGECYFLLSEWAHMSVIHTYTHIHTYSTTCVWCCWYSVEEDGQDHFSRFHMRRRSKLPMPKVESDVSVWSLLCKNIGKDLSKISMPVSMNEPLNALQVRQISFCFVMCFSFG